MLPEITTMQLDFLRPFWLVGLIAIFLFSFLRYKNNNKEKHQALIAPHLSANIVSKAGHSKKHQLILNTLAVITCIALAGPTWRNIDMPVYEVEKAQVIVFDLSYSMFASDIKPSRLAQAKFKAIDLIKQWSEGEKAMIAYAGDAFTVTPLTRDGNAIINHIPHLSPDIMPVRGSRADIALNKAIELLKNAGYAQGHIVFISDDISNTQAEKMQKTLKKENWIVSILAVATPQGSPITLPDGSLLKNDNNEIIIPKLSGQPFYNIASTSNGLYLTSRNDSSDINQLGSYYDDVKQTRKNESDQMASDQFAIDDGYWLSFLLLPLFLLLFRKGVFFALLLTIYLPLSSPPLEAAETSMWKNSKQNAFDAYQNAEYQAASELYNTPLDKGNALYKSKQYDKALEQYNKASELQPDNANVFYNQGNNYAQLQQFDKAIESYNKALALDPGMALASENKKLLEQIKKQQQQGEQQKQDEQAQKNEQQKQDEQAQKNEQQKQDEQAQKNEQQKQDEQAQKDEQQKQDEQAQKDEQQKQDEQAKKKEQQKQAEQLTEENEQQPKKTPQEAQLSESKEESNQELEALPNWLKNMPDDPSILLRRKMQLEYQKRSQSQPVKQKTNNGVIW